MKMGLTIHYDLKLSSFYQDSPTQMSLAIERMEQIRRYAASLPVDWVTELKVARDLPNETYLADWDRWRCADRLRPLVDRGFSKEDACLLLRPRELVRSYSMGKARERVKRVYDLPIRHAIGFLVQPAEGTETMDIVLTCNHPHGTLPEPPFIPKSASRLWNEPEKWLGGGFCKTIYAANHGLANFVFGHMAVCKILAFAGSLEHMAVRVYDEGDYAKKKSLAGLVQHAGDIRDLPLSFEQTPTDRKAFMLACADSPQLFFDVNRPFNNVPTEEKAGEFASA